MEDRFIVRVKRPILLPKAALGSLFVLFGLDLILWHTLFPAANSPGLLLCALVFFVAPGGAIVLDSLLSLLSPPIMLELTPEGIAFGMGFRYRLHRLPWSAVEGVDDGRKLTAATAPELPGVVVCVTFRDDPDVPAELATSAGISFACRRLTLSWLYMDSPASVVLMEVARFKQQYGPPKTRQEPF